MNPNLVQICVELALLHLTLHSSSNQANLASLSLGYDSITSHKRVCQGSLACIKGRKHVRQQVKERLSLKQRQRKDHHTKVCVDKAQRKLVMSRG